MALDLIARVKREIASERAGLSSGERPAPRIKEPRRRHAAKALAFFFAAMVLLTIFSNVVTGAAVARVTLAKPSSGVLTNRVEINGTIEADGELAITLPEGVEVLRVPVGVGDRVRAGDTLIELDGSSVARAVETLENKLELVGLRLDAIDSGSAPDSSTADARAEVESASESLADARAEYDRLANSRTDVEARLKSDLDAARDEYDRTLRDAKVALADAINDRERTTRDGEIAVERAETALSEAQFDRDEAKAALEKAEKKAKESLVKDAEDKLKSAEDNLSLVRETSDDLIASAQERVDSASDQRTAADSAMFAAGDVYSRASKAADSAKSELERLFAEEPDNKEAISAASSAYSAAVLERNSALAQYNSASNQGDAAYREWLRAEKNLKSVKEKQQKKLDEAEKALSDAKSELEKAQAKTDMSEENIVVAAAQTLRSAERQADAAQNALDDARRSLESSRENADRSVSDAEQVIGRSDGSEEVCHPAALRALETAERAYDDGIASFESQLRSAERAVTSAERQLDSANRALDRARRSDLSSAQSIEQAERQAEIDRLGCIAERRELERQLSVLSGISADGRVLAPTDGVLRAVPETGRFAQETKAVALTRSDLGFRFVGSISEKSAKELSVGNSGTLRFSQEGKSRELQAVVTSIGAPNDGGMVDVTAELSGSFPAGASAVFEISSRSEQYPTCVPITALRRDSTGNFVYVARESSGILGVQLTAERVGVDVKAKDSEYAAVEGVLGRDDRVIVSSSRPLEKGDRVRETD